MSVPLLTGFAKSKVNRVFLIIYIDEIEIYLNVISQNRLQKYNNLNNTKFTKSHICYF
ncbi:hypothetical protein VCRA2123O444_20326 [Vibrio crassostreae]|nr:hypothetical protein VCRA2118O429_10103 [Vibrio crassostreae]CAK1881042.1 hypothetical protein VCRA2110O182_10662 [Vibrio crassostreae]CAK1969302.1 hypothetical protein VCRA2113O416_20102 [Vibrio crassostreae]CAK1975425.1 hypothetical protein VCRA2117O428_20101 [Vibrio crassostreae]CAK1977303.1 hypothetical protein VCRA2119O430_20101 [Vibrio crassostreae]